MNTAYDNPERPHTPSYIGNYESYPENGPGVPYVYREEPPVKKAPLPSSSSTVGFLPSEKKAQHGRDRRGISFVLVALLILFLAVAIVMTALYISRDSRDEKVTENGGTSGETVNIKVLFSVVLQCLMVNKEGLKTRKSLSTAVECSSSHFQTSRPSNAIKVIQV